MNPTVEKLAREARKAAQLAARNTFLIETLLSRRDARMGKTRIHTSVQALFRKLEI